jgi:hypothetical protein
MRVGGLEVTERVREMGGDRGRLICVKDPTPHSVLSLWIGRLPCVDCLHAWRLTLLAEESSWTESRFCGGRDVEPP